MEQNEGINYVICAICGEKQKQITDAHLKTHDMTFEEYLEKFPGRIWRCADLQTEMTKNQIRSQYNNDKNVCKLCGKSIKWNQTFCSRECANAFRKKPLVQSTCLECKTPFHHLLSNTDPKFCCRACFDKYKSKIKKSNDWRQNTLERDSFQCVLCGYHENLRVHHIDENSKNNDDNNLLTLCESCHRRVHHGLCLTVYKTFTIEIAHHLPDHHTCGTIHGHSVDITVGVKGPLNLQTGMVIDFKKLKEILQTVVIDRFDHTYLNNMFVKPTSEIFAFYIYTQLHHAGLKVSVVRVHETHDNYAEFTTR
jgi:6-pyruvoyltetrahydropterin/6-carboxytetrahydropterin synthase